MSYLIAVTCSACGDVDICPERFWVAIDKPPKFWADCPKCGGRVSGQFAMAGQLQECLDAGASVGTTPAEALEERSGSPVSVDEVLDAKIVLSSVDCLVSLIDLDCMCPMCAKGAPKSACMKR